MKKLKYFTLLLLITTSCSKNSLPVISELNKEAMGQLNELENIIGMPSEQSQRLGIKTSDLIQMKEIQITRVFKQDEKIMLVSRLKLASKNQEFFTNVIFNYKSNQNSFKELINRMIQTENINENKVKRVTLL